MPVPQAAPHMHPVGGDADMKEPYVVFERNYGGSTVQICSYKYPDLKPEQLPWDDFYRVGWTILHTKYGPDVQFEKEPSTR